MFEELCMYQFQGQDPWDHKYSFDIVLQNLVWFGVKGFDFEGLTGAP